jgi:GR25 family glycosyltransferase involved in LPS biosynthesis
MKIFIVLVIGTILLYTLWYFFDKKKEYNNLDKFETLQKNLEKYKALHTEFTCKIPYPVYYINMDKDKDRRDFMEKQAKNIGKTFTRIPGFNGYSIKNTETDTVNDITFYNGYEDLTKAEIGCTLSHLIAINTAYNNGDDIALICEDDLLFDTCLVNGITMEEITNNCPDNWGIIQVAALIDDSNNIPKTKEIYSYIARSKRQFAGAAGYLINKKGMEEVLNRVTRKKFPDTYFIEPFKPSFPLEGPADKFILDLAETYTIVPSPFIPNSMMNSTIHQEHIPYHVKCSLNSLQYYPLINH